MIINIQEEPLMLQCPFNKNHYVPRSSLEKHKEKCQYAVHGVDPELIEEIVYSSQPDMTISMCVCVCVCSISSPLALRL